MQRYYIAVPNKVKWTYQTIASWKNYSFTGTLEEAQKKAIELFIEEGHLDNDEILDCLSDYFDESTFNQISENWEDLLDEEKYKYCKNFYSDYLQFEIDDFNKGLTLWNNVSNDEKINSFQDELRVIELD